MAKQRAVKAKVELHPKYKVPRRFYDVDEEASTGNTRQIAEDFLKKVAGDLQINPDLSGLKFDQIKESMLGKYVLFQQQHSGRPITGAWVRVDIDPSGKVFNLQSDLFPNKILAKAEASAATTATSITADQARAKALAVTGSLRDRRKGLILDPIELFRRGAVSGDRLVVPRGGEALHEVAGRDDVDARLTDQLDGARVDARDIRDGAARRVFHRDATVSFEQLTQSLLEFRATCVLPRAAR